MLTRTSRPSLSGVGQWAGSDDEEEEPVPGQALRGTDHGAELQGTPLNTSPPHRVGMFQPGRSIESCEFRKRSFIQSKAQSSVE